MSSIRVNTARESGPFVAHDQHQGENNGVLFRIGRAIKEIFFKFINFFYSTQEEPQSTPKKAMANLDAGLTIKEVLRADQMYYKHEELRSEMNPSDEDIVELISKRRAESQGA